MHPTLPSRLRSRFSAVRVLGSAAFLTLALAVSAAPTRPGPIRLGSNENHFGMSPKAIAAVQAAVASGNFYNRDEIDELVKVLAEKENLPKDYFMTTPGSGPVLESTAMAFAIGNPGMNIVTAAPGYPQLSGMFAKFGGTIKYVNVNARRGIDFKAMLQAIDEKTSIVYVCNPNNPTGVLAVPSELKEFIMKVPEKVLVFVDEAYLELAETSYAVNTVAPLTKLRKNLMVSRTFSKAYALAGLRAGYGIAHPDLLAKVQPYSLEEPSYLAAIAAREAVLDKAHLEANRQKYIEVRKMVLTEFKRMGIEYAEPSGAFVLFKAGVNNDEVRKKMLDAGIMVTKPFGLGPLEKEYSDWVRVSIGQKEDMDLFLGELAKILGKT